MVQDKDSKLVTTKTSTTTKTYDADCLCQNARLLQKVAGLLRTCSALAYCAVVWCSKTKAHRLDNAVVKNKWVPGTIVIVGHQRIAL